MAEFSFITSLGNVVVLPNAPAALLEYNNYVVYGNGGQYFVVCFDRVLECFFSSYSGYSFNKSNGAFVKIFQYDRGFWFEKEDDFIIRSNFSMYSFSDSLSEYKELFSSYSYFIELPVKELSVFILRPIIEVAHKNDDFLYYTFNEIFSILPVLITVLISFIGIRKGFSFLMSHINKS